MRIESDMSDADIQKFFETYIKTANPTAVMSRLRRALFASLEGKELVGAAPEVKLMHEFYLGVDDLHREMEESEARLFQNG